MCQHLEKKEVHTYNMVALAAAIQHGLMSKSYSVNLEFFPLFLVIEARSCVVPAFFFLPIDSFHFRVHARPVHSAQ